MDAHEETDRMLAELEAELEAHYDKLGDKLNRIQATALKDYYRQRENKKDQLENGEITNDEYKAWLRNQARSATARNTAKKLAEETVKADLGAAKIINGAVAAIYVMNSLASYKQMAKEAQKLKDKFNFSVSIAHEATQEEIHAAYRKEAETRKLNKAAFQVVINKMKDGIWTQRHFESAVQHGFRAGYSEEKMEKAFREVMGENYRSCVRYARTYATANEGMAVYDNALRMEQEGWIMSKQWLAMHDRRTRDSHRNQNNETLYEMEKPFRNGLLYPGDRSTDDPGEFINCRCRMECRPIGVREDVSTGDTGQYGSSKGKNKGRH